MPRASIDALVSSPPVNTPSARPPSSKSLISSPCSRMIWPISPGPGFLRCRAASASRNSREPPMAPIEPGPPWVTSNRAVASLLKVSRFSSGSPSTSQMTRNGIGNAKVGTRSTVSEPCPAARDLVELAVDDRLDAGPQPRQPAHRELGGQQPRAAGCGPGGR